MTGRQMRAIVAAIVTAGVLLLGSPWRTADAARLPAAAKSYREVSLAATTPDRDDRAALLEAMTTALGARQSLRLGYLATWPTARLERLNVWLAIGIRFEGPWSSEELGLTLTVLDAFGTTYGEARFAQLAGAAVSAGSMGLATSLRLVRVRGHHIPAAVWYGWSGRIVLNDGFFDDAFLHDYYHWSFLRGEHATLPAGLTTREVVMGHELGHVLVDGLRAVATSAGLDEPKMETLYAQTIEERQWPHPYAVVTENLATEMAAWALNVTRTPQVETFRATVSHQLLAIVKSAEHDIGATPQSGLVAAPAEP